MPSLIKDVKSSVGSLKSELTALKNKSLQINKSICNIDDVISTISSSTQTQDEKAPVNVYNFEVEDWHTYHVGTHGILVHNLDCYWDPEVNKMHGKLPSESELDKLQPKQLRKLAEHFEKSIETRTLENECLGDVNGALEGHEARIDGEIQVLEYIRNLLENLEF